MEARVSSDVSCGYTSLGVGGIHEYGDLEATSGNQEKVFKPLMN
jgi:hypothetical protein